MLDSFPQGKVYSWLYHKVSTCKFNSLNYTLFLKISIKVENLLYMPPKIPLSTIWRFNELPFYGILDKMNAKVRLYKILGVTGKLGQLLPLWEVKPETFESICVILAKPPHSSCLPTLALFSLLSWDQIAPTPFPSGHLNRSKSHTFLPEIKEAVHANI